MAKLSKIANLEDLIKNKVKGELVSQNVSSLLPPGENFGSVMYKVDFTVKENEQEKEYFAVAKCVPLNKVTQELFNIQVSFKSEIAWYTTVIPTLKQFQNDNGVEKVANFFQEFYGARISLNPNSDVVDTNGVILTENLTVSGYKNVDRHIGFDLKTSQAVLRDLATFHAVPLAIKLANKELFEKNIRPYLPNFHFKEDPSMAEHHPLVGILKELEEVPEVAPYIERARKNAMGTKPFSDDSQTREPWGSICHNDFWINNIMIKEGPEIKTIILDLQFPCYNTIAADVLFFLVVSTALEVAQNHLDELLRYYYDQFIQNLVQLNIESTQFPYDEFLEEVNKVASHGQFPHALMHTNIILEEKGVSHFDASDENFKMENFKRDEKKSLNERQKRKYTWLIVEFAKRNWI